MKTVYRMKFTKTGRAKYISHLDLMRCFQRCIRRADLPIAYSEGFHPHMLIVFAAALSLGFESDCEIIEVQLSETLSFDEVRERMSAILPEGIEVTACYAPVHKMGQMGYAEYVVNIPGDGATLMNEWDRFISQEKILTEKKTKRGTKEIDLKEQTEVLSTEATDTGIRLLLRLPAGSTVNVNPSLLIDEFGKTCKFSLGYPNFRRVKLLSAEKTEFF